MLVIYMQYIYRIMLTLVRDHGIQYTISSSVRCIQFIFIYFYLFITLCDEVWRSFYTYEYHLYINTLRIFILQTHGKDLYSSQLVQYVFIRSLKSVELPVRCFSVVITAGVDSHRPIGNTINSMHMNIRYKFEVVRSLLLLITLLTLCLAPKASAVYDAALGVLVNVTM